MIELSLLYALAMTFSLVLLSTPNDKSTFKDGHHTIVSECGIDIYNVHVALQTRKVQTEMGTFTIFCQSGVEHEML